MRIERAVLLCLVLSFSALAEEPTDERARTAAAAGKVAFDAGDFATAITRYQEAWRLKPVPSLLFNLGQSYRRAGNLTEALVSFRRYLETKPPAEQAAATEALIRSTEATQKFERDTKERTLRLDETKVALAQSESKNASQRLELELAKRQAVEPATPRLTERWWFWTGLGVVVVGAVTVTAVAASPQPVTPTWQDINGR